MTLVKYGSEPTNQEARFSSAVKCKKGPQVLTSLLNQIQKFYYYILWWIVIVEGQGGILP